MIGAEIGIRETVPELQAQLPDNSIRGMLNSNSSSNSNWRVSDGQRQRNTCGSPITEGRERRLEETDEEGKGIIAEDSQIDSIYLPFLFLSVSI